MKTELIVALDVSGGREAAALIDRLPPEVNYYKVGLELFCAEGPSILQAIRSRKKNIFLDLKLHDLPRIVERAVRAAAVHGVDMLTVHASGGRAMLKAAVDTARSCMRPPKIIAVSALTNLDQQDLADLGITRDLSIHAIALADMAFRTGAHGLICSPHELAMLRRRFGPARILVTAGIRMSGNEIADQKRAVTPFDASQAGANFIVVGRPILEAPDPAKAALEFIRDLNR